MPSTPKKAASGPKRYADGRVAVVAHLEAIKAWLQTGATLRAFFDKNRQTLPLSYSQLVRHVGKLIPGFKRPRHDHTPTRAPIESQTRPTEPAKPLDPSTAHSSKGQVGTGRPRFEHNPVPVSDKELF